MATRKSSTRGILAILLCVFIVVALFPFVSELLQPPSESEELTVEFLKTQPDGLGNARKTSLIQLQQRIAMLEDKMGEYMREIADLNGKLRDKEAGSLARTQHVGTRSEQEVWARGPPIGVDDRDDAIITQVNDQLSEEEKGELKALCGRCLFGTLFRAVDMTAGGRYTYVQTGDINLMWTRDSAVQIAIYMPRMTRFPAIRLVVEGVIRKMAFNIVHDPYANSYAKQWFDPRPGHEPRINKRFRVIGRGGWTGTRNYELDSGGYFMSMVWNYFQTPGLQNPEWLMSEPVVFDAVNRMVDTWIVEQRHENSNYRYAELPNEGRGPDCGYTGMTWTAFTPADDPVRYGYHIPSNMYAVAGLDRMIELNKAVWKNDDFARKATKLRDEIRSGIEKFGIIDLGNEGKVYAYEVNGLGQSRHDFDDANVPSLLAIPVLGYKYYDPEIYQNTRRRLFSAANQYFFRGSQLEGLGSPHTPHGSIWSMALCIQGLTTANVNERVKILRMLLKMQCGNGLMHESVNVDNPSSCTRVWFEWANALFVVYAENAMGIDCTESAENLRRSEILNAESPSFSPGNGIVASRDDALFYHTLENQIRYSADGGSDRGWFET